MGKLIVVAWFLLGFLAYTGQMAHRRIDPYPDRLCRQVNTEAVCDDRLLADRSFYMFWGIGGGPISFVITAATTGFFHAGLRL